MIKFAVRMISIKEFLLYWFAETPNYTANCHNLHFWTPTPTLPHWEREHKESADYARLQYIVCPNRWAAA